MLPGCELPGQRASGVSSLVFRQCSTQSESACRGALGHSVQCKETATDGGGGPQPHPTLALLPPEHLQVSWEPKK